MSEHQPNNVTAAGVMDEQAAFQQWVKTQDNGVSLYEAYLHGKSRAAASAQATQAVAERCARMAELYGNEHAWSKETQEACTEIARACRDHGAELQVAAPSPAAREAGDGVTKP